MVYLVLVQNWMGCGGGRGGSGDAERSRGGGGGGESIWRGGGYEIYHRHPRIRSGWNTITVFIISSIFICACHHSFPGMSSFISQLCILFSIEFRHSFIGLFKNELDNTTLHNENRFWLIQYRQNIAR
jgi:hypothetical protein